MADAYFIFRKRFPFSLRLNGKPWQVSLQTGMKSGMIAVVAAPQHGPGKFYILTSGKEAAVQQDLLRGILVSSGTPERGLVTALRRAGAVIVMSERLPPVCG